MELLKALLQNNYQQFALIPEMKFGNTCIYVEKLKIKFGVFTWKYDKLMYHMQYNPLNQLVEVQVNHNTNT